MYTKFWVLLNCIRILKCLKLLLLLMTFLDPQSMYNIVRTAEWK